MKLRLSENIRSLRKQKHMTQENLAEALGVTVGAVYKWENGLSQPELNLIVELADFFDTSVDALLGYSLSDNRLESALERLGALCRTMDPEALSLAEKLLVKYPHSFSAVHACAQVYLAFGVGGWDKALIKRARELLEQARLLIGQSDDKNVNEASVLGEIAITLGLAGEYDQCLEVLKTNNASGMFDSEIGTLLAIFMGRTEEAVPYLSSALLRTVADFFDTVGGYVFVLCARKDWDSALAAAKLGLDFLSGLRLEEKPDALEKGRAEMLALLSHVQSRAGLAREAENTLSQAAAAALTFDSMPDYSLRTARFGDKTEDTVFIDIFGNTVKGSVKKLLELAKNEKLAAKWEELTNDGN
ncbi:MAG: helix-turn-helix domain-containing protein [Clostridia bacterium]|nr:helix-turn-helix domain-containing protein [Clostridia bacterium]